MSFPTLPVCAERSISSRKHQRYSVQPKGAIPCLKWIEVLLLISHCAPACSARLGARNDVIRTPFMQGRHACLRSFACSLARPEDCSCRVCGRKDASRKGMRGHSNSSSTMCIYLSIYMYIYVYLYMKEFFLSGKCSVVVDCFPKDLPLVSAPSLRACPGFLLLCVMDLVLCAWELHRLGPKPTENQI